LRRLNQAEPYRFRFGVARRYVRLQRQLDDLAAEERAVRDEFERRRVRLQAQHAQVTQTLHTLAEDHYEASEEKHLDLAYGIRVQGRLLKAGWAITDPDAFLSALNTEDLDEVAPL